MALDAGHFTRTLAGLQQLKQFSKALDEAGLMLAWSSFPEAAKRELSNAQWSWAASQYLLDSEPPKELPIHLALLRYPYRVRDGVASLEWGLREDLPERMRLASEFHPPVVPEQHRLVAATPEPEPTGGVLDGVSWLGADAAHPNMPSSIPVLLARLVLTGRCTIEDLDEPSPDIQRLRRESLIRGIKVPPHRNLLREWIGKNPVQWRELQDFYAKQTTPAGAVL